ncbi:MAG: HEAT repeat domain-containing protein [Phycisphaerae bacterium]
MTRSFVRLAAVAAVLALLAGAAGAAEAPSKADIDQAVGALAAYKAGQEHTPVTRIGELLQAMHGKADLQKHMEQKLIGLLESDADYEAKLQACQVLARIGTEACIPALEKMLDDPKTTHIACWALEPNPSAEALAALRRGLQDAKGEAAVTIMGVLGQRRDEMAVPILEKHIGAHSEMVAEAALAAVGKIATPKAADILATARKSVGKALRGAANDAYLQCANRLADAGRTDRAVTMFEDVLEDDVAIRYHRGALIALMRHAGGKAVPHVLAAIRSNDQMMQGTAIANVPLLEGKDVVKRLSAELPKQSARIQALLVSALADRGGDDARKVVTDVVDADEPEARVAAVKALARIGDASSVPLLVKAAGQGKTKAEREAALISLRRLSGEGADAAILKAMKTAKPPVRAELISVIHGRGTKSAVPALLEQAAADDEAVQAAALKALAHLAEPDHLADLVERLVNLKAAKARPAAERAVVQVAQKTETPAAGSRPVLAALKKTDDVLTRTSLLRVLGGIGGEAALAAVTDALDARQEGVRDAAVRALGSWPDASAVPALLGLVKKTDDRTYRVVALRGAARLLAKGAGVPSDDVLQPYKDLMALSERPEDKKLVLAGLADVPHPEALRMAVDSLDNKAVQGEAAMAAVKIGEAVMGSAPKAVAAAMEQVVKAAPNDATKKQARQVLGRARQLGSGILGWQIAGPYTKQNVRFWQLCNLAFAPEKEGEPAEWRICPVKTKGKTHILMVHEILGQGDNRTAYVRTWLVADKAADARLEAGSDDAIKIWLNGKAIHENRQGGACEPGEHKKNVRLKQGANALMLKITNDSGPWEFSARIVGRDGKPLDGVTVDPYHAK